MGNGQSLPTPTDARKPDACPVDHKSRQAWLEKSREAAAAGQQPPPMPHPAAGQSVQSPSATAPLGTSNPTCDSSKLDQTPAPASTTSKILHSVGLSTQREVSTIPRAPLAAESKQKNSEQQAQAQEEDEYKKNTNWIYPSPKMFYDAMKRKSMEPQAAEMEQIVPIHNAVNERVWIEIKAWEKKWGTDKCEGPFGGTFLESFHGMGDQLSPKARINTWLGYQAPFDRHEWVINRCGRRVEYLIDFYAGKDEKRPGKSLNFYLDVRPKLNSWEGWAMRGSKIMGLDFTKPDA